MKWKINEVDGEKVSFPIAMNARKLSHDRSNTANASLLCFKMSVCRVTRLLQCWSPVGVFTPECPDIKAGQQNCLLSYLSDILNMLH